jgi:hypothetical protein
MANEAGMNDGAVPKFPADQDLEPWRSAPGAVNLRTCILRPLKVGGGGKPITRVGKILETGEGAMNGIILIVTPTIAALGALRLLVQALNAAKANPARARVPVRRQRSR